MDVPEHSLAVPLSDPPARPVRPAVRWAAIAKSLLLIAGLVAAGLALRGVSLDHLRAPGGWGSYLGLAAAACAVGVPRQAVAFAGGYGFGAGTGFFLALAATMLACAVDFIWARLLARHWMRRFLSRRNAAGRMARLDRFLAAHPFSATLTLRLLPVGSNLLLNLLAGVFNVRPMPFMAATLLGYVPQTLIFALLGGGTRIGHGLQLAVAAGLFMLSMVLGGWLYRRTRVGRAARAADEAGAGAPSESEPMSET